MPCKEFGNPIKHTHYDGREGGFVWTCGNESSSKRGNAQCDNTECEESSDTIANILLNFPNRDAEKMLRFKSNQAVRDISLDKEPKHYKSNQQDEGYRLYRGPHFPYQNTAVCFLTLRCLLVWRSTRGSAFTIADYPQLGRQSEHRRYTAKS